MKYASFWKRLGANIIDGAMRTFFVLVGAAFFIAGAFGQNTVMMILGAAFGIIGYFSLLFYNDIWRTAEYGCSFGKKIMKIRIVNEKEKNPDFLIAFFRAFTKVFFLAIGLPGALAYAVPILAGEKKQSISDHIVKTFVIEDERK